MRINWAERVAAAAAAAAGCAVSPGHFCVCARVVFAVTELKFFCAACVCVCVCVCVCELDASPRHQALTGVIYPPHPQVCKKS